MKHYVGLDVSQKEASVCVVDEAGKFLSSCPIRALSPRLFVSCPMFLQGIPFLTSTAFLELCLPIMVLKK
jgi:hypothetical protein